MKYEPTSLHRKIILNNKELLIKLTGWDEDKLKNTLKSLSNKKSIKIEKNVAELFHIGTYPSEEYRNIREGKKNHIDIFSEEEKRLFTILYEDSEIYK